MGLFCICSDIYFTYMYQYFLDFCDIAHVSDIGPSWPIGPSIGYHGPLVYYTHFLRKKIVGIMGFFVGGGMFMNSSSAFHEYLDCEKFMNSSYLNTHLELFMNLQLLNSS